MLVPDKSMQARDLVNRASSGDKLSNCGSMIPCRPYRHSSRPDMNNVGSKVDSQRPEETTGPVITASLSDVIVKRLSRLDVPGSRFWLLGRAERTISRRWEVRQGRSDRRNKGEIVCRRSKADVEGRMRLKDGRQNP